MANYWSKGQEGKAKKYVSKLKNKEQKAFGLAYLDEKFNNKRVNLKDYSIMSSDEIQDIVEVIDKFLPWEKEESLKKCECDNTHKQNKTVCRYCWGKGKRFKINKKEGLKKVKDFVSSLLNGNENEAHDLIVNHGEEIEDILKTL